MTDDVAARARNEALAEPDRRRAFAVLVVEETDLRLDELSDLIGPDDRLLREEDTLWVLERRAVAPAGRRLYWARAARLLARGSASATIWDRIITLCQTEADLAEEFSFFLMPVALDSPWAREERERRQRVTEHAAARAAAAVRVSELIARGLAADEARRLLAWPNLLDALATDPDGRKVLDRFDTPPTELPGWKASPTDTRTRIIAAAKRYLDEAVPPDDAWVGTNTIPGVVVCGYAALRLIVDVDPVWLDRRDSALWERWAAAILGYPAWREEGHRRLVRALYTRAPAPVLRLLPRLAPERDLLDELDPLWGPPLAGVLLALLTAEPPPPPRIFRNLATRLLAHGDADAQRRLEEDALQALGGTAQPVHLPDLLLLLLTRRPSLWPALWPRIAADRALALTVARRWAADDRYEHYTAGVPEAALGELYEWLASAFATRWQLPRRRWRRIEADQELARFHAKLPHLIGSHGTDEAFATLDRLADALPEHASHLREAGRRARQQRRKQEWRSLTVEQARRACSA